MPLFLVANRCWAVIPIAAQFWFLGGPEADNPCSEYYQEGWGGYDAQVYVRKGRWYFSSATIGPTVNDQLVLDDGVELKTGDRLGAPNACEIEIFVLTSSSETGGLVKELAKRGISKGRAMSSESLKELRN